MVFLGSGENAWQLVFSGGERESLGHLMHFVGSSLQMTFKLIAHLELKP